MSAQAGGHPVGSDSPSGVVRFLNPFNSDSTAPAEPLIGRIEGRRPCGQCHRLHEYQVGVTLPGDEVPTSLLFDSWEEASHQVLTWLPEAGLYLGRREPEDQADASEFLFDTRAAAIWWLLEPA